VTTLDVFTRHDEQNASSPLVKNDIVNRLLIDVEWELARLLHP
jgi:hypothetical protein